MYKEIIIIIVVIALVVGLDVIENKENAQSQMKKVKDLWLKKYDILAYYIEHDELEKVSTELVKLEADINMEDYKHCMNELSASIFILEHIEQKEKLDIKSIF